MVSLNNFPKRIVSLAPSITEILFALGLDDNIVGFEISNYYNTLSLVIDPVLSYSSFLGHNLSDSTKDIAVDSSGNAYVTGQTGSAAFPTASPIDGSRSGQFDAFVTKINPASSWINLGNKCIRATTK